MDTTRFDELARSLATAATTRRHALLRGAIWPGPGLAGIALTSDKVPAKRKRKRKSTPLCKTNGSSYKQKGATCRESNWLKAPITVEARWTGPNALYATDFFLPKDAANPKPSPFISSTENIACTPETSDCEETIYPFARISQDAPGPGPAMTSGRRLLKGTYEYWIYVISDSLEGALTVPLRDANAQIPRTWSRPDNPNPFYLSWHLFDIDGAVGSVKSVDETNQNGMPGGAHSPNTNACPGGPG